jgi:superfamily II DNA or RNA helicase
MTKRQHQIDMERAVEGIISGRPVKYILAVVTPGGGKSALPQIAGRLIPAGLAEALCWVVPRKSLQHQGETNFIDPFFRQLFDHRLVIRSSTNDPDPCRGLNGFITTYQAIGVDEEQTVLRDFCKRRYVLILDEFHHAEQAGVWHQALEQLVKHAAYVVLMTGTLERGDGSQIAFVPYVQHFNRKRPVIESSDQLGLRVIRYGRRDALAEKAIIPLQFSMTDAEVKWINQMGASVHCESMATVTRRDASAAIYTALDTDYAKQLTTMAVEHWQAYRQYNRRAKLLVVTAGLKHARGAVEFLKGHGLNAEIATSHESAAALTAISRFKQGAIDILVTIAMAYEGLDVPSISHLVCLTHIRSRPWIEQMLARAVRVDHLAGPWESQCAYVFAPDDPLFREIVQKIEQEQEPFVKAGRPGMQTTLFDQKSAGTGDSNGDIARRLGIVPVESSMTGSRHMLMGSNDAAPSAPATGKTPSQLEAELRDKIERYVRAFSFQHRYRNGRINREIRRYFEKPRAEMTLAELEKCWRHIQRAYPLNAATAQVQTNSPPRARRPRVSTKVSTWEERGI